MQPTYKILILGGYGVFGGRLGTLLSDTPGLEIIVAGRNLSRATAYCGAQTGATQFVAKALDRQNIQSALADIRPNLLVDATGPFQDYGDTPYHVVEAAIHAKVNYIDLADSNSFVNGVAKYDSDAKSAGVFVLSGASSFPVLTMAVLRACAADITLSDVTAGIAPSPYAGVGLNVMRAVISYAGSPIQIRRNGVTSAAPGLAESKNYTIAPPGLMPLHHKRFSLIDVPDNAAIPATYPDIHSVWIGAGPEPASLLKILNAFAWLRAKFRLPSYARFSRLFYWVLNRMKFGEHRGGMFVAMTGQKDGKTIKRSWHMLAEGDDGPLIPSMAISGIVTKILAGDEPAMGARSAQTALELSDYETMFQRYDIQTGLRDDSDAERPLFETTLQSAFAALPDTVQTLHRPGKTAVWNGRASIDRGKNPLAKLIATIFRFPNAGEDVETQVTITTHADGSEVWQRKFGNAIFRSHLKSGKGRDTHLITETFGPVSFGLAMVVKDAQLHFVPRRWRALGIPMPKFLIPTGASFEEERDGRFHFHVEITLPIIGRVVRYRGWLTPA